MKIIRFIPFLFCALFCFSNTSSATAQELYFHLYNNTGSTISKVYVSPSEANDWNNNIIPRRYVYDESQLTIYVPYHYGATCLFDVKVVATDGESWKFADVDLCNLYRLTVNWNDTYQTEWASY